MRERLLSARSHGDRGSRNVPDSTWPRCAADTENRCEEATAAYSAAFPEGPQVDALTNTQAHYEATQQQAKPDAHDAPTGTAAGLAP